MKGKFITIEGPDGAGKTTNIAHLVATLQKHQFEVVQTREPGGTPLSEQLRTMLLHDRMAPMTELLIFAAARAEHIAQVILPALEAGKIVVCDRFADSTYAYQGMGRGYVKEVEELERFVLKGFEPDYTLFFDLSLEESMRRLAGRADSNLFDVETRKFKQLVYQGYQKRFTDNPHRMFHINAMQTREQVEQAVINWVNQVFVPRVQSHETDEIFPATATE